MKKIIVGIVVILVLAGGTFVSCGMDWASAEKPYSIPLLAS